MSTLFTDRVRVAIANTHKTHALRGLNESAGRAALALDGYEDIPTLAALSIDDVAKSKDSITSQGLLLEAFWRSFAHHYEPFPVEARLWVNPPDVHTADGQSFTYQTQKWLLGEHGTMLRTPDLSNPMVVSAIRGESTGFFDDITFFWDRGVDPAVFTGLLAPKSTITLVRPRPDRHGFWMGWADLDLNFNSFFRVIDKLYKVVPIAQDERGEIIVSIFGLEHKE